MTCIIGLVDDRNRTIHMGADSMAANGWDARVTKVSKIFERDNVLFGYSTSFRMGQILRHHLEIRPRDAFIGPPMSIMDYMVTVLVDDIRKCLKDYGYSSIENNREEGGEILVGYGGHLFYIGGDFQVNEYADGFAAIGCGYAYAMGAMKALSDVRPEDRIALALGIAGHFSNGVCGPFTLMKVGYQ